MEGKFIPYPAFEDKDFYEKIYYKKEFYDTIAPPLPDPADQSPETLGKIYRKDGDFSLLPQQRFLRNYISEATPYNGIFLFHETGTGKSCASIAIAERFRHRVEETGKRILIVVGRNIRDEFFKTIFHFDKESSKVSKRQVVQCTGRTYQLGEEARYLTEKQKRKLIEKMIHTYYEIIGHGQLVNQAKKIANWDGKEDSVTPSIQARLREHYSDRVMIVDEVHNRIDTEDQDDSTPTIMKVIIEATKNVKLVLMSATPMVNSPADIMFIMNLLRRNDKRDIVQPAIFFKDDKLRPEMSKKFQEYVKGYVSYVRAGDPPRFPYKLIPPEAQLASPTYQLYGEKIPEKKKMKSTKLILVPSSDYHFKTYRHVLEQEITSETGGLFSSTAQACNIVFPSQEEYGRYGNEGYGGKQSDVHPLLEVKDSRGEIAYQYAPWAEGFLLAEKIQTYSPKFYAIYQNILRSKGISYVYSDYLKSGVVSLALMLEENGFSPALLTGTEHHLLRSKSKKPPICYMCGETRHPPREDHTWSPARYILFTGSQELKQMEAAKISGYLNRKENMYGKLVKVLLGSKISGEGIDFKRIRQVHIVEGRFHQTKMDQVEGRAVRNGSHIDLPPEERNVDIFKYCLVPPKKIKGVLGKTETIDERLYALSEDKDRRIKEVVRLLKEAAVDCMFEHDNNVRLIRRTIHLQDSKGRNITFVTGDKPYSRECDYQKNCDYACVWKPKKMKMLLDKSTYGPEFAMADIEKAREHIQEIFRVNLAVDQKSLFSYLKKKAPGIDDIYIYMALELLMNPDGYYAVYDKYGREGYLLNRGDLYIYHPFVVRDTSAPSYYKKTPLAVKPSDVPFPVEMMEEKIDEKTVNKKTGEEVLREIWIRFQMMRKIMDMYTKKYEKYVNELYGITVDFLPDQWAVDMVCYLMSPRFEVSDFEKLGEKKEVELFAKGLIRYFSEQGNIMVKDDVLAVMVGGIAYQWGRTEYGSRKKDATWGKCDPDVESYMETEQKEYHRKKLWEKLAAIRIPAELTRTEYLQIVKNSKQFSEYVGTVEPMSQKQGFKFFKILDFTREEKIKRKDKERSKRSEIRGRVCSTFRNEYLSHVLDILEKDAGKLKDVTISENRGNKSIRMAVCARIEFLLRILNKNTPTIWFYRSEFLGE